MKNNMNQLGIKGSYEFQVKDKEGNVLSDTGEQSNLILDAALDYSNPFQYSNYLALGSGVVTEPAVTDTALGNEVYSDSISLSLNNYSVDSSGLTSRHKVTNIIKNTTAEYSEIGIKKRGAYNSEISDYEYIQLTRALIKDSSGAATTISVTSDQELHITYYVYFFIPWVIGSGVTPTPHGDLAWEYKLPYDETASSLSLERIANAVKSPYCWGSTSGFYLGAGLATLSSSDDIPNRTRSITLQRSAKTSDFSVAAGVVFLTPDSAQYGSYRLYATSGYTIPANYDFTITLQCTWGRLP